MTKACGRCGRIHPYSFICTKGKTYNGGEERKLRARNKWHEKSQQIREDAGRLCELHRSRGEYRYADLEVHHIEKLKDHPELLLEDSNLICLCQECHKEADAGRIPKQILWDIAADRIKRVSDLAKVETT